MVLPQDLDHFFQLHELNGTWADTAQVQALAKYAACGVIVWNSSARKVNILATGIRDPTDLVV